MSGVNKVILVGNLGAEPEARTLNDGSKVVNLRLATSETWKDKSTGERKERTEWHSVAIFNESLGRVAEDFLRKGSRVYLEGALQTRKWTDREERERYTTEIVLQRFRGELVLLDGRQDRDDGESSLAGPGTPFSGASERRPSSPPARQARTGGTAIQERQARYARDLDDDVSF